jgi:hypothetical protein
MVTERAERRNAERISGVSNLTYDLISLLHNKLEAISAYDVYRQDARDARNEQVAALFDYCLAKDRAIVDRLRALLVEQLRAQPEGQVTQEEADTLLQRGGDLSPTRAEEEVDDASEDSFPASDPPSFTRTSTG